MNEPLAHPLSVRPARRIAKDARFQLRPDDFQAANPAPADPPFWTELKFNRCANCPLNEQQHPHCPAALQMASALEPLKALVSFDTVGVTVLQFERKVYAETTVQQAMSSVFGLIMATSGCPWTDRLRPMARFHVPFAGETETLYRSVSMYLLSREFVPATSVPRTAADSRARGPLQESACRESRYVAPLGRRGDAPIRRATRLALLDSFTTAAARCARALARRAAAVVLGLANPLVFGHLTYRDGL